MEKQSSTGYPSVDRPWIKYYSEKIINAKLPECSLYEYLYENNKEHLNEIAIEYFGKRITYGTLFEQIDTVAKAFLTQGVAPGDIVSIVSLTCVTSILCFYALNKIGAVSNFINVLASEEELIQYFSDAKSKLIVILNVFGEKVVPAAKAANVKKIIVYSLSEWMPIGTKIGFQIKMHKMDTNLMKEDLVMPWNAFLKSGSTVKLDSDYRKNADELGFLAHTGGTTGFPKSVMVSDRAMNAVAHQYKLCMAYKRGQVFLGILMPFVMYGILIGTHIPLCLGLTLSIIPKFEFDQWPVYFKKNHPNHIAAIPAILSPLLEDSGMKAVDLSALITVASGGDGMDVSLENKLNAFLAAHGSKAKIIKGYGLTEVCATAVTGFANCNKIGSIGIPMVANNVKIVREGTLTECAVEEPGEICLLCPSVMLGYGTENGDDENPFHVHEDGERWFHTGDLGYIDKDGFLFLVGRMKRQIVVQMNGGAYKIYPNQIERIILSVETVHSACVVGIKEQKDMRLGAFIISDEPDINGLEARLRALCEEKLPDYMRPTKYVFIERMPLTPVGKIDYRALEERI